VKRALFVLALLLPATQAKSPLSALLFPPEEKVAQVCQLARRDAQKGVNRLGELTHLHFLPERENGLERIAFFPPLAMAYQACGEGDLEGRKMAGFLAVTLYGAVRDPVAVREWLTWFSLRRGNREVARLSPIGKEVGPGGGWERKCEPECLFRGFVAYLFALEGESRKAAEEAETASVLYRAKVREKEKALPLPEAFVAKVLAFPGR